jgi:hypothetical protein
MTNRVSGKRVEKPKGFFSRKPSQAQVFSFRMTGFWWVGGVKRRVLHWNLIMNNNSGKTRRFTPHNTLQPVILSIYSTFLHA